MNAHVSALAIVSINSKIHAYIHMNKDAFSEHNNECT